MIAEVAAALPVIGYTLAVSLLVIVGGLAVLSIGAVAVLWACRLIDWMAP